MHVLTSILLDQMAHAAIVMLIVGMVFIILRDERPR